MANHTSAHPDVICTTTSIPQLSIRKLFSRRVDVHVHVPLPPRHSTETTPASSLSTHTHSHTHSHTYHQSFTIPIFQRRYCWEKEHLKKLLVDISQQCSYPVVDSASASASHDLSECPISLGRIIVTCVGRTVVVVDGQQRLTSICLLLASIRDFISRHLELNKETICIEFKSSLLSLENFCNNFLHPAGDANVCILEPTYFDRESFRSCMKHSGRTYFTRRDHADVSNVSSSRDHILSAKQFLDETFLNGSLLRVVWTKIAPRTPVIENSHSFVLSTCASLVQTVLDKIGVLYFDVDKNISNNLQCVYERLAMREALLSPDLYNSSPGVLMRESDLVRNLVTSFFFDVNDKIRIFEELWIPIEKLSQQQECNGPSNTQSGKSVNIGNLDDCICAFISTMPEPPLPPQATSSTTISWVDPGSKCFPLYHKLQDCFHRKLSTLNDASGTDKEKVISSLLQDIYTFAVEYFKVQDSVSGTEGNNMNCVTGVTGGTSKLVKVVPATTGNIISNPCLCYQRGTLCTDCIILKYAPKKSV